MTRDEITARLEDVRPLRIGELARMAGVGRPTLRKMVQVTVRIRVERRVPIREAERILRDLRIL